jgi:hypothetical protein
LTQWFVQIAVGPVAGLPLSHSMSISSWSTLPFVLSLVSCVGGGGQLKEPVGWIIHQSTWWHSVAAGTDQQCPELQTQRGLLGRVID